MQGETAHKLEPRDKGKDTAWSVVTSAADMLSRSGRRGSGEGFVKGW
jgi:hypothetical protein